MARSLEEVQATILKSLGHPTRVKIVTILCREHSMCVCELVERLGFDQSTVSKHLSVLKTAGILKATKRGLYVRYGIRVPCVGRFLKCVECMAESGPEGPPCHLCRMYR